MSLTDNLHVTPLGETYAVQAVAIAIAAKKVMCKSCHTNKYNFF